MKLLIILQTAIDNSDFLVYNIKKYKSDNAAKVRKIPFKAVP